MTSPIETWEHFFLSCDLPSSVCKQYAQRFVKERMQPYMLKEIGKEELKQLGIGALGDQLAIIRYIKLHDGNIPEFTQKSSSSRTVRVSNENIEEEDNNMDYSTFKAPDRDDIYHIKMPIGNTPKTRSILQKQSILINKGIIKRGTSGVRVSGINVPRVLEKSRVIRKKPVMIQDISSSSPAIGSLRSDEISHRTTVVVSPQKKNVTPSSSNIQTRTKIQNTAQQQRRIVYTSQNFDERVIQQTLRNNQITMERPRVQHDTFIREIQQLRRPQISGINERRKPIKIEKRSNILNRISITR